MQVETKIKLNKFIPRPYQYPFCDSFDRGEKRKYFLVHPRRCLSGDSHILMADGSLRLLRDIAVGDLVLSWDGLTMGFDRVSDKWSVGVKVAVKVKSPIQPDIICSPDHIFAHVSPDGDFAVKWDRIGNIDKTDRLITYRGFRVLGVTNLLLEDCEFPSFTIESTDPVEMYDIETERNHNFIANGFLVHNSGKDYIALNMLLRAALRTVGAYCYCLPTSRQCKGVIWDAIDNNGNKFIDCIPAELIKKKNNVDLTIELINGSLIRFVGSNNFDRSLVGLNLKIAVFSEFSRADPMAYRLTLPIINANDGKIVIISTPFGHNHFYDLYQIAKNNLDEWYCEVLTVNETQHIPIELIKRDVASGEMSEDLAKREYYCDFSVGNAGSYFAVYMEKMRLEDRITTVPYEPHFPVHCSFDLGMHNPTCIIFFQVIGAVIHVIDYYQNVSQGLEHYVRYIQSKEYTYGKFFVPHDIAVRELTSGMTRREKLIELGINIVDSVKLSLEDGIEAVMSTLPRCWIDEQKCAVLISALERYRREKDELRNVYYERPVKDATADPVDAFRYMCININRCGRESSPEELQARYNKVVYGSDQINGPFKSPI